MSKDAIFQALTIAAILGGIKFAREQTILKAQIEPLVEWWRKTSIDALKIATNPTSKRLAELANQYTASVNGKTKMLAAEKQELIDGLRGLLDDKDSTKRESASLSLRFIESRERSLMLSNSRPHRNTRSDWSFYVSLLALSLAGFLFIVGIYTLYFGGTASSRIAYAVMMSVIPSCITALVFKSTRLIANWWRMAVVYFVCFWLLQGVLVVVR